MFHIILKIGKCVAEHATLTHQKIAASMECLSSCPLVIVKMKVKSAFLLWHHHHHGDTNTSFQVKLANFFS